MSNCFRGEGRGEKNFGKFFGGENHSGVPSV